MNKKTMEVFTDEERAFLSMYFNSKKSSWEVGEILDKAHYKVLEMKTRVRKFIEIFNDHYESYPELVPEVCELDPRFKEFLDLTMCQRLKPNEAGREIGRGFEISRVRLDTITSEMKTLARREGIEYKELNFLIKEFDRFNNFRILPPDCQEPSGYLRRQSSKLKRHLTQLIEVPEVAFIYLKKNYQYKGSKRKMFYIRLNEIPKTYEIVQVKDTDKNRKYFGKIKMYLFTKKEEAESYGDLVLEFKRKHKPKVAECQRFWKSYKELVAKSLNYKELNQITNYKIDMADIIDE